MHMTYRTCLVLLAAAGALAGCAGGPSARSPSRTTRLASLGPASPTTAANAALQEATRQVIATERAFANTMAQRDFKAFLTFLSPDAIFFSGNQVERGRGQIAAQWAPYFDLRRAPFSWTPDHVEVLPDGKLALSTGPLIEDGTIVGRFNSVWRLEAPNTWHIVFDKGEAVCQSPRPAELPQTRGLGSEPP